MYHMIALFTNGGAPEQWLADSLKTETFETGLTLFWTGLASFETLGRLPGRPIFGGETAWVRRFAAL
jgi:hypothetical protein